MKKGNRRKKANNIYRREENMNKKLSVAKT